MRIDKRFKYEVTPKANERAVVKGEKYRFTVLTSGLIRIEYDENGVFEDRATQTVVNRVFPVPEFSVSKNGGILTIATKNVELTYAEGKPFSQYTLSARYIGKNAGVLSAEYDGHPCDRWYFGLKSCGNLKGTARTLDGVDGECPLDDGIMSTGSIVVLDDSKTLALCDDGWVEPRSGNKIDQYIFCYGDAEKKYDYKACLADFYTLTGKTPLLPRFVFGNWWSRYHAYTQDEYLELMERFKKEDIPFSVGVIDMDWHYVNIDPKYGRGWTGYTWNEELFPDHKAMLKKLADEGLKVSLNLHPQAGVAPHEKAYGEMAEAMGVDPASEEAVPFEIENPKFLENYFKILHHPLEMEGVNFWWLDWQQGSTTSIEGLDPLWMLNHYHYIDNCKDKTRGLLFSRYAGPGSHRYPIGFSGDTVISWDTLKFQPYFTATASNIGYGWWSHDIGGHWSGKRDEELTARWVQFGTFSPINRLHSTQSRFLGKEPWKYNIASEHSMKKFLKLRHELIPYLYTMNRRASENGEPLIEPLYYNYFGKEMYEVKNEYFFGTEMIVSPITTPADDATLMGSAKTFLPDGVWYDFFNHLRYEGGRYITMYRNLDEMPVLVKAGGIVPMSELTHVNDVENPVNMNIKVFAGADNEFELYEDDGETFGFENGAYAVTKMSLKWGNDAFFTVSAPEGDASVVPEKRNFKLEFVGVKDCAEIKVSENGVLKEFTVEKNPDSVTVCVKEVSGELAVSLKSVVKAENRVFERVLTVIEKLASIGNQNIVKDDMMDIVMKEKCKAKALSRLMQFDDVDKNVLKALTEIITADCAE